MRGVAVALFFSVFGAGMAWAEAAKPCLAIELPQQDSGFSVIGTYAGQTLEFKVTVDGKPVEMDPKKPPQEFKATCAYTS